MRYLAGISAQRQQHIQVADAVLYDQTKFREATVQNGFPIPLYMDGNFNNRNILDLCKPTKLRAEGVSKCFELAVYIWNDNFSDEIVPKLMQLYKILK